MNAEQDPEVERIWNEIRERPRELEPRRRLAKVLSEKGDPFGELLTLALMTDEECSARSQEGKLAGDPYRFYKYRDGRLKALMAEHGNTWFPKYSDDSFPPHPDSLKGRGMPDHLTISSFTKDPLEKIKEFTARWPLRTLLITMKDPTPVIDALEAGGHFARMEELTLSLNHWSPAALEALRRASPGALKVELNSVKIAPSDWSSLLSARAFAETRTLGLVKNSLEGTALETLWANFPKLEALNLYHSIPKVPPQLGPKPLRELQLAGPLTENQVIALLKGLELRSVQRLALIEDTGSSRAIRWILDEAQRGQFESLEKLVLQESWLNDDQVEALALVAPKSLRILDLDRSSFGAKGVAALAKLANSGRCPKLEAIRMWAIFVGTGRYIGGDDGGGLWEPKPSREIELTLEEIHQKFGFPAGLKLK